MNGPLGTVVLDEPADPTGVAEPIGGPSVRTGTAGIAATEGIDGTEPPAARRPMKFAFAPESKPLSGYTIKRGIHRGGFGEVYYALSDGGKEVALKYLLHQWDVELRGVAQCLNLKHPHLVTIFDVREDDEGRNWIVMEYVSGPSLEAVLAEHPQGLPVEEVRRWLTGMVAGLSYLHDSGIVHRDLKPGNVALDGPTVKVGDVGLSKFITQSRRNAQTESVGTVHYMAPEVAHGRYGREVDVYSLGVVLFEMLTGRVPFDGETTGEILMKHLSESPDLTPVPERFRPVVARALEKDPLRRTPTPAELEREFLLALAGRDVPFTIPDESFVGPRRENGAPRTNGRPVDPHARDATRTHRRPEPPVRPARHAEPLRRRHESSAPHGSGLWWRIALIGVVALALFAPASFGGLARGIFVGGVFGVFGYGLYWLVTLLLGTRQSYPPPQSSERIEPPDERIREARAAYESFAPSPSRRAVPEVVAPGGRGVRHGVPATGERILGLRARIGEWLGSLAYALPITLVLGGCLWLLAPHLFQETGAGTDVAAWHGSGPLPPVDPATFGLYLLGTLLTSWAVLTSVKLTEGLGLDGRTRRGVQFAAGTVVGGLLWGATKLLLVDLPFATHGHVPQAMFSTLGSNPLFDASHRPTLVAFAVFFGLGLALRGWWIAGDAVRESRFRLRWLVVPTLIGWILPHVFAFPHAWGPLWFVSTAIVVPLAAAWEPRPART